MMLIIRNANQNFEQISIDSIKSIKGMAVTAVDWDIFCNGVCCWSLEKDK